MTTFTISPFVSIFSLSVRLSAARKAEWWMCCNCPSLAAVGIISILPPSLLPSLIVLHSSLSHCVANIERYESPACARRLQQQQPKRHEGRERRGEKGKERVDGEQQTANSHQFYKILFVLSVRNTHASVCVCVMKRKVKDSEAVQLCVHPGNGKWWKLQISIPTKST